MSIYLMTWGSWMYLTLASFRRSDMSQYLVERVTNSLSQLSIFELTDLLVTSGNYVVD